MAIHVAHLFEHPHHTRLIAEAIYAEFWTGKPGYNPEFFEKLLRDASDPDRIPLSLLALVDGRPAGTVNLIANDDPARPRLEPWLAALIVFPKFRGLGAGKRLVRELLGHAWRLGHETVYFGTDIPEFYLPLGARFVERFDEGVSVMRFDRPE